MPSDYSMQYMLVENCNYCKILPGIFSETQAITSMQTLLPQEATLLYTVLPSGGTRSKALNRLDSICSAHCENVQCSCGVRIPHTHMGGNIHIYEHPRSAERLQVMTN